MYYLESPHTKLFTILSIVFLAVSLISYSLEIDRCPVCLGINWGPALSLLMVIVILEYIVLFRQIPQEERYDGWGGLLRIFLEAPEATIAVFVFLLFVPSIICPSQCGIALIPTSLSGWAFLLGSVTLLSYVYLLFKRRLKLN